MPIGARLAITARCPECDYLVKPIIVMFSADPDRPHAEVQCPRPECQHIFHIYPDADDYRT